MVHQNKPTKTRSDAAKRAAIIAALEQVDRDPDGLLQVDAVVDAARDPNSPLHSEFEWDDTIAGELYRKDQARRLVRVYVEMAPTGQCRPIYVNIKTDRPEGGGYRKTADVMASDELLKKLRQTAEGELKAWVDRWSPMLPSYARQVALGAGMSFASPNILPLSEAGN